MFSFFVTVLRDVLWPQRGNAQTGKAIHSNNTMAIRVSTLYTHLSEEKILKWVKKNSGILAFLRHHHLWCGLQRIVERDFLKDLQGKIGTLKKRVKWRRRRLSQQVLRRMHTHSKPRACKTASLLYVRTTVLTAAGAVSPSFLPVIMHTVVRLALSQESC